MKSLLAAFLSCLVLAGSVCTAEVLVKPHAEMKFLANASAPDEGMDWVKADFNDADWSDGQYGVGYEEGGKSNPLVKTEVAEGTRSIFTRTTFMVSDVDAIDGLQLGGDYDDAYAVWINGKEVYRSPEMPRRAISWDSEVELHESSNSRTPVFGKMIDVTERAKSALVKGENVAAIGVWNAKATSSDLVIVPKLVNEDTQRLLVRGPYLQQGGPNQMIIKWRSGQPMDSAVRFGLTEGALDQIVKSEERTTEHEVLLTGLKPYTTYYYSVGDAKGALAGGTADYVFRTSPEVGKANPMRIWVLGDSGTANAAAASVRDAYLKLTGEKYTDLLLMLGDNAYNDGKDSQYQNAVFDMYPSILRQTPVWSTLGNHDGHAADSATQSGPYYEIFSFPKAGEIGGLASGTEAYYSFDYANVHFVVLDSYETDRSVDGPMMAWMKNDLAETTQEWLIAFWHHPPYTKGSHNSDKEKNLVDMRKNFLPVLESYGVDLIMGGHSHCYERSHPIKGHYKTSDTLTDDMVFQKNTDDYIKTLSGADKGKGAIYAVAGSSGKLGGGSLNHPVMKVSLRELGSMIIEIDGRNMTAQFLNSDNTVRDAFTVEKAD